MEVILLEKIRHLGALGHTVKVKPGFARNFLIPQGKAVYATRDNIDKFEARRAELEKHAALLQQEALKRQAAINALSGLTLMAKAGEEGKLFGSIGTRDIVDVVEKAGVTVEKSEICLPDGPLRTLGEHEITIELDSDVSAVIKLTIMAEA
ncbi:MAG: 50S ribosomal protein L9 [Gammaproteobacteria bacterium RIFCSPHIGHO2_12_FULL_45_12]|nr:MAG: 50S ribosomal protein L9 [Gammaproteobacteria bacterium RIFCSPHIGHO2_12_FULL_45_12]